LSLTGQGNCRQPHDRLALAEQEKINAVELAQSKITHQMERASAVKDAAIAELKGLLQSAEVARELAVAQALGALEKERDALATDLQQAKKDRQAADDMAKAQWANELQKTAAAKEAEIQALKAQLDAKETAQRLAIKEALSEVEKERDALKSDLGRSELEKQLAANALKEKYETQISPASADRECQHKCIRTVAATLF
jgi:hypothetical protein